MTRREILTLALPALAAPGVMRGLARLEVRLAEVDKSSGGRLGCAVLNTSTGAVIAHRGGERFPMCRTFETSAVAMVLQRADWRIVFSERDLVPYSPITELHVGGTGMAVADLCAAAMTVSDNTAANLLLASFGGPAALTNFWRAISDSVTRLDRTEPELNEATPGDPRDTTTPAAMVVNLHKFVFGDVLKPVSRERLREVAGRQHYRRCSFCGLVFRATG